MTLKEAMLVRHCVREYTDRPIPDDIVAKLRDTVDECNRESSLSIQLVIDEPKAFDGIMAHYGKFSGVRNYVVLIGRKSPDLSEKCGYYGEKIVLTAQTLGLNSCWVGLTYSKVKGAYTVGKDEKLVLVIALGYGKTQGLPRQTESRLNPRLCYFCVKGVAGIIIEIKISVWRHGLAFIGGSFHVEQIYR